MNYPYLQIEEDKYIYFIFSNKQIKRYIFRRVCSSVAIRRFTQWTTSSDLTRIIKSNCRSTSAWHVLLGRSRHQCTRLVRVVFVTLIATSHQLCFHVMRLIATSSPNMFSRIYYPIQLVVGLLFVFALVRTATKPKNHIHNRHRCGASLGGPLCVIINLIVRLFPGTFLHTMSLWHHKTIHHNPQKVQ
jgi:hypothetical protein